MYNVLLLYHNGWQSPVYNIFVYLHVFEYLRSYINRYSAAPLTDQEFEILSSAFQPRSLRKKQYFLQEGEVCKYMGFIVKGAVRQYSVDDKGVEHIVNLSIENWWVGDRESWVMLTPSVYNIDAWEDTDLLVITRADFLGLLDSVPAMHGIIKSLDEKHAIATQKRLTASISFSAEKRYADLASRYPELLQRFPQHLIASYLGITKETLSRVRQRSVKK
ncbi:Crp/Fnr family transcriptional regulator [Chitinophaga tropicalis]|uniref:Crp/Fnr family transcriptional regulator n=1 Tax=Chitinophaga tropicalis TaxID=2683588 RepID=UPI0012FBCBA4|nr:Crp/Fnr family transcriptional regulator [Chitinophaga tropicalis]